MPTIDADAHVVETEHTWDYMEPADRQYRPRLVAPEGESGRQYWMVEGKIRGLARQVIMSGMQEDFPKLRFGLPSERGGGRMPDTGLNG